MIPSAKHENGLRRWTDQVNPEVEFHILQRDDLLLHHNMIIIVVIVPRTELHDYVQ